MPEATLAPNSRPREKWGRLDLLVNNAGITSQGRKDLLEATEES